ncbi:MAG TPA: hypothetical protein VHC43_08755 [Mycobacteriales bacterium]|nr:hypothetical protein [Mycobacteriales bacterium]
MRAFAVALGAALIGSLAPAGAIAATPRVVTIADPSTNTAPSGSFRAACADMSQTVASNQACDSAAVPDFDAARAAEGVKPLVLPEDFDTLALPFQLLAITDLERVDRGLPPVPGLSSRLDDLAQQGADADDDPPFPSPFGGTSAGASWADGDSALYAAFRWMYDDGPGSGNTECTAGQQGACWGHRHTILDGYDSPIAMGAAFSATGSGSITEEVVGGDSSDPIDEAPTWATISGTLDYGVSPTNVSLSTDVGTSKTATVTATSAGGSGQLAAGFESGAPRWSVSPAECDLADNASCTFVVTFSPTSVGRVPGVLTISNGTNVKTVALSGTGFKPQVSLAVTTGSIPKGHALTIHGVVTANPTNDLLAHRKVELQRKLAGGSWTNLGSDTTSGRGKVAYHLHPKHTAKYRLEVIGSDGKVQAKSSAAKVRVTR